MKKFLSCFALAICVVLGTVSLTACGSGTKWLQPNFSYDGDELTVEFVTNAEKDFTFPIANMKFEHSKFTDENILEYGWIIYNGEHELVGWIEAGNGYDIDKKGNYVYGFGASTNNGVYGYSDTLFLLVFKGTDLTIFDRVKFDSDYGSIRQTTDVDLNPMHGQSRFFDYDDQTGESTPKAGSENFVCCLYSFALADIDPNGPKTVNVTFSLEDK